VRLCFWVCFLQIIFVEFESLYLFGKLVVMLFVDMVFVFEFLNFIEMHFGELNLFFDFFFLFYQLAELIFERSKHIT
jgi:hypothetical protein